MKRNLILNAFAFLLFLTAHAQEPTELGPEALAVWQSSRYRYDMNDPQNVFDVGYAQVYYGNDAVGNELMLYALSKMDSVTGEQYQELSVQNTKNGNHVQAIAALEKAVALDPQIYGYYGWVLLYYYHEYNRALECLEKYDALTPNFSDAPAGEDIHHQKGQCYMQLGLLEKALEEFDTYIGETTRSHGEDWVDPYTFVYKGRCLDRLNRYEEALVCYDKGIRCYKYNTEAHYYKALSLLRLKRENEAREHLRKALELARQNYFYRDVYVAFFEAVYLQDIEAAWEAMGGR